MWRGACATNLSLEFELPEPVALGAIEVWNYNAEWQTKDGMRKADVAVSPDGTTWETVLRGAEFAEAEGTADYDEPIQLKLKGATARKVRFENIVPWNDNGKVGLSKVVFHQATSAQAGPRTPEDGATGISIGKLALEWVAGQGATEHKVFLGTAADNLALVGTTSADAAGGAGVEAGHDLLLASGRGAGGRAHGDRARGALWDHRAGRVVEAR